MDDHEFDEYAVEVDRVQIGHLLLCAAKLGEKGRLVIMLYKRCEGRKKTQDFKSPIRKVECPPAMVTNVDRRRYGMGHGFVERHGESWIGDSPVDLKERQ